MQRFWARGDRLVVLQPSPFLEKLNRYAKEFQRDDETVRPIRDFIKLIVQDSDRCLLVSKNEAGELPVSVVEKLSIGNFSSDAYLFETVSFIPFEKNILTTDVRLKAQFDSENWCRVRLVSEFLTDY